MATEDSSEIVREMSESVAATNLKSLGDAPAFYNNLAFANAVAHQHAMNQIGQAGVAKAVEMILGTNPREGGADIAALMQLIKAAQTTPPVTA